VSCNPYERIINEHDNEKPSVDADEEAQPMQRAEMEFEDGTSLHNTGTIS